MIYQCSSQPSLTPNCYARFINDLTIKNNIYIVYYFHVQKKYISSYYERPPMGTNFFNPPVVVYNSTSSKSSMILSNDLKRFSTLLLGFGGCRVGGAVESQWRLLDRPPGSRLILFLVGEEGSGAAALLLVVEPLSDVIRLSFSSCSFMILSKEAKILSMLLLGFGGCRLTLTGESMTPRDSNDNSFLGGEREGESGSLSEEAPVTLLEPPDFPSDFSFFPKKLARHAIELYLPFDNPKSFLLELDLLPMLGLLEIVDFDLWPMLGRPLRLDDSCFSAAGFSIDPSSLLELVKVQALAERATPFFLPGRIPENRLDCFLGGDASCCFC